MTLDEARAVLGLTIDADSATTRTAYRRALLRAHPDQGGTREAFDRVTRAYQRLAVRESGPSTTGTARPAFARLRLVNGLLTADVRGDLLRRRAVELHVMLGRFDSLAHGVLDLPRAILLPLRKNVRLENARGESWHEAVVVRAPARMARLAPYQWEEDDGRDHGE